MNYTYVTVLSDASYLKGVLGLYRSLKKVSAKYPLLGLVSEDVTENITATINSWGV